MKKLFLLMIAVVCALGVAAQDVIVKNDGSTVVCRVLSVGGSEVIYKKWSDLDGPNYVMERSNVASINYQDGRQDSFGQADNRYGYGIQNTGEQNYNDNMLLKLDYQINNNSNLKKAKTLKIIGWTVGPALIIGGGVLMAVGLAWGIDYDGDWGYNDGVGLFYPGLVAAAGGIATMTGCLIKAHKLEKEANMYAVAPVFQHEFNFGNNSSLMAGVDMIRDNRFKQTSLGLGLRFNF